MNIAIVAGDAVPTETTEHSDAAAQRAHLYAVARELGREHRVSIYTRLDSPDCRPKARLAPGVTVEHLPAGPAKKLPEEGVLRYISDFGEQLMRRWDADPPDIIHAYSWTGGLAVMAGAQGIDIPITQTLPRVPVGPAAGAARGTASRADAARVRLARAIGRRAAAVIAGCADQESELIRLGVPRRSIAVVPCGIDVERFRRHGPAASRGKRPRLLHVGPLSAEAGAHTAVRALAGIADAELVVAGGPTAEQIEADPEAHRLLLVAKEAGVDDRVIFLGPVPTAMVPRLMRGSDVVVSLPREASAGAVALEAMACGVPVIASAVGAHLDAVLDGVTGLLVPPDHPARTARLARELLADPTRRAALGFAGADRARSRYSFQRISHELLRVYEDALACAR